MILVKQGIDIIVKKVNIATRLPILSIDLKFVDQTRLCISTFYRYGYSDLADYLEAEKYYTELCRKMKDVILVGDLNLSSVEDWSCPAAVNELENMYVDLFNDLNLTSLVNVGTHSAGNSLDQVLTNRTACIGNLSVTPNLLCPSDHYTITFEIYKTVKRKKPSKKRVFSYRRGIGLVLIVSLEK